MTKKYKKLDLPKPVVNKDIEFIRTECARKRISVSQLCAQVGLRGTVLTRWEKKPPMYYLLIEELKNQINQIGADK